jgi:hypothetical protein
LTILPRTLAEQSPSSIRIANPWQPQEFTRAPLANAPTWSVLTPRNLSWHGGDPAKRQALWQAGMNFQPLTVLKWIAAIGPLVVAMMYLAGATPVVLGMAVMLMINMAGGMAPLMALQSWNIRASLLEQEFLRPAGREDFARDLLLTYLKSCWPLLLVIGPTLGIDIWKGMPLPAMAAKLILGAGAVSLCLSITLVQFAFVRRWWTGVVGGLAAVIPMQFLLMMNAVAADALSPAIAKYTGWMLLAGLCLSGLAGAIGTVLFNRMMRREWGAT